MPIHKEAVSDWSAARQQTPLFNVVGLPKNTIHRDLPYPRCPLSVGFH